MQTIKDFFDTSAGAALVASAFATVAMAAAAMALWPESVALIVFG